MIIAELIEELKKYDENTEVVIYDIDNDTTANIDSLYLDTDGLNIAT